jgi:hypothetical protein
LHWTTAVGDVLETFKNCLQLDDSDNAEWIRWQLVEMFLQISASEIQEARKKERRGYKQPATDLGKHKGVK